MVTDMCIGDVVLIPKLMGSDYESHFKKIFSRKGMTAKESLAFQKKLEDLLENNPDKEGLVDEVCFLKQASSDALNRQLNGKGISWFQVGILSLLLAFFLSFSLTNKVEAAPGEDTAFYAEVLGYFQQLMQWIQVFQGAIATLNGGLEYLIKQSDNNMTALLDLETENYNKVQVAQGTIAEKAMTQMEEQRKAWSMLGNTTGSSVCVGDAAYGGILSLRDDDYEWVDNYNDMVVDNNVSNNARNRASDNGRILAGISEIIDNPDASDSQKELAKQAVSISTKGKRVLPGSEAEISAKTALTLYSGSPAALPKGAHKQLAASEFGSEVLGAIAARLIRRDTAIRSASSEVARSVASKELYDAIYSNAESLTISPSSDTEESVQENKRNVMMGRMIVTYLKTNFSEEAISSNDALQMLTDIRLTPQYSEFIRSSGPVATPLVRDVIHNQIIALQQRSRLIELQEKTLSVLSSLLLEVQDDPARVQALAEQRKNALGGRTQ